MKLVWGIVQNKSTVVVTGSCDEKTKREFLGNGTAEKRHAKVVKFHYSWNGRKIDGLIYA